MDLEVLYQQNRIGPDIFGFYRHEIVDLLAQDVDETLSQLTSRAKESVNVYPNAAQENGKQTDSTSRVSSLFSNSIQDAVPDIKKELLKSSLRQSVRALTQEVNEIVDPVIRIRHMISFLSSENQGLAGKDPAGENSTEPPCKKQKTSSSNAKRDLFPDQKIDAVNETGEVNETLKFLLESEDSLQLKETITRHSDELDAELNHMQEQLEELLDAIVSKCRPMTRQEKLELCKLIQKLPPKNLDRVVEIIQVHRGKSLDTLSSDEIFVELEEQGNVTLWRLYFYVKAVENARKLSVDPVHVANLV